MEKKTPDVVSTQKSLQPNHEPGWNDPPPWAFSSIPNSGDGPKRQLNKRVGFPISSNPDKSNNQYIPTYRSFPTTHTTNSYTTSSPFSFSDETVEDDESNSAIFINSDESFKTILENSKNLMKTMESEKLQDIEKSLGKMELMWSEDKFDKIVQKKIYDIFEALKISDFKTADRLHISLMVNNANICSSWISGIGQLIKDIKNKTES